MTRAMGLAEEWRAAPDYEGRYEVSSLGRIRSLPRRGVCGGVLTPHADRDGYPQVTLRRGGKRYAVPLHRLVALAFHGNKRNELHKEVAHLDGDQTNAGADNLKWVGKVQNFSHRKAHGTWPSGERNPFARLTPDVVRAIRACRGTATAEELAETHGISRRTVSDIWRGRRWPHLLAEGQAPQLLRSLDQ